MKEMESQPKVYIITGGRNQGKTTLLGNVVKVLQEHELETIGFLSEMISDDPGKREYFLTNINTGNQQLLCSTETYPGWKKFGRFSFNPVVVELGNDILLNNYSPRPDFYIIDEVGKLEIEGEIWEKAINTLLKSDDIKLIWTTRDSNLADVVKHFKLLNYRIFEVGEINEEEIIQSIILK